MYAYIRYLSNGGEKDEDGQAINSGATTYQDQARCLAESGDNDERVHSMAVGKGT